jgi:hypothetical protein
MFAADESRQSFQRGAELAAPQPRGRLRTTSRDRVLRDLVGAESGAFAAQTQIGKPGGDMRSVFVHLSECVEAEVAQFLDSKFRRAADGTWSDGDDVTTWVKFYRDVEFEYDPSVLDRLRRRFSGKLLVSVVADISGRVTGRDEAKTFVGSMLKRWPGVAMDDHSDRFWVLDEVVEEKECDGLKFFVGPAMA